MKISVVTICRNAERTIGRAVESFLRQDHADKEMVLVDGASEDATLSVVRSFGAAAVKIHSAPDRGLYDAMNKGLALFAGEAVGFLNADDRLHDAGALGKISAALEGSDAVYGDLLMQHQGRVVRQWRAGTRGAFRAGWMPPHPTFYARRALVEAVGCFDTQYHIAADYDFMLRALELHQARLSYIPHTLVDFSLGGRSTRNLKALITANLECLHSRRRHLGGARLDWALFAKPARKLSQLRWS